MSEIDLVTWAVQKAAVLDMSCFYEMFSLCSESNHSFTHHSFIHLLIHIRTDTIFATAQF